MSGGVSAKRRRTSNRISLSSLKSPGVGPPFSGRNSGAVGAPLGQGMNHTTAWASPGRPSGPETGCASFSPKATRTGSARWRNRAPGVKLPHHGLESGVRPLIRRSRTAAAALSNQFLMCLSCDCEACRRKACSLCATKVLGARQPSCQRVRRIIIRFHEGSDPAGASLRAMYRQQQRAVRERIAPTDDGQRLPPHSVALLSL